MTHNVLVWFTNPHLTIEERGEDAFDTSKTTNQLSSDFWFDEDLIESMSISQPMLTNMEKTISIKVKNPLNFMADYSTIVEDIPETILSTNPMGASVPGDWNGVVVSDAEFIVYKGTHDDFVTQGDDTLDQWDDKRTKTLLGIFYVEKVTYDQIAQTYTIDGRDAVALMRRWAVWDQPLKFPPDKGVNEVYVGQIIHYLFHWMGVWHRHKSDGLAHRTVLDKGVKQLVEEEDIPDIDEVYSTNMKFSPPSIKSQTDEQILENELIGDAINTFLQYTGYKVYVKDEIKNGIPRSVFVFEPPAYKLYNMGDASVDDTENLFGKYRTVGPPDDVYGAGNIDLYNRPVVHNPDGSISTVLSLTFWPDDDDRVTIGDKFSEDVGKYILLTSIRFGLDRGMTTTETWQWYQDTGQYLGKFNSDAEAEAYAEQLHINQGTYYEEDGGVAYTHVTKLDSLFYCPTDTHWNPITITGITHTQDVDPVRHYVKVRAKTKTVLMDDPDFVGCIRMRAGWDRTGVVIETTIDDVDAVGVAQAIMFQIRELYTSISVTWSDAVKFAPRLYTFDINEVDNGINIQVNGVLQCVKNEIRWTGTKYETTTSFTPSNVLIGESNDSTNRPIISAIAGSGSFYAWWSGVDLELSSATSVSYTLKWENVRTEEETSQVFEVPFAEITEGLISGDEYQLQVQTNVDSTLSEWSYKASVTPVWIDPQISALTIFDPDFEEKYPGVVRGGSAKVWMVR